MSHADWFQSQLEALDIPRDLDTYLGQRLESIAMLVLTMADDFNRVAEFWPLGLEFRGYREPYPAFRSFRSRSPAEGIDVIQFECEGSEILYRVGGGAERQVLADSDVPEDIIRRAVRSFLEDEKGRRSQR